MAQKSVCGECQNAINDVEQPVQCGLCEAVFHVSLSCCGFTSQHTRNAVLQGKTVFICPSCRRKLDGRTICAYLKETNCSDVVSSEPAKDVTNDLSVQVQQLASIVKQLNGKVDDLCKRKQFASKAGSSSGPPKQKATPLYAEVAGGVQRLAKEKMPSPQAHEGTKLIDFSGLSVPSIAATPPAPKFWLYLTGFDPRLTNDDMGVIVSRCLDLVVPSTDIKRLVKQGADTSGWSFVSYKIGLAPDMKGMALSDVWPKGISYREFVDYSKNSETALDGAEAST